MLGRTFAGKAQLRLEVMFIWRSLENACLFIRYLSKVFLLSPNTYLHINFLKYLQFSVSFSEENIFSLPFRTFRPIFRRPVQTFRINTNFPLLQRTAVLFERFIVDANDVLALIVVNQVQNLQGRDDVLLLNAGHFANFAESKRKNVKKIRLSLCTPT
jgi:hypothetical protein